MDFKKIIIIGFAMSCLLLTAAACEKEGTAEKAGKEVDRALDSAKKKLDDVTK
jgi:hypothetical protein